MLREQAGPHPQGPVGARGRRLDRRAVRRTRLPTVAELNAAAPDTPVFVLHLYQSAILNRAALQAVGFTRDTPDPHGRRRSSATGTASPTACSWPPRAPLILYSTLAKAPTLEREDKIGSTRHFLRELNRFGLTSAIDAAGGFQNFPDNYGTVTELAERGRADRPHRLPPVPADRRPGTRRPRPLDRDGPPRGRRRVAAAERRR